MVPHYRYEGIAGTPAVTHILAPAPTQEPPLIVGSNGSAFGIWGAEAWDDLVHAIRTAAEHCLAMAMAAAGLGTSFNQLKGLGFKPFLVGIAAAVSVGAVSIVLVFILAPLISV